MYVSSFSVTNQFGCSHEHSFNQCCFKRMRIRNRPFFAGSDNRILTFMKKKKLKSYTYRVITSSLNRIWSVPDPNPNLAFVADPYSSLAFVTDPDTATIMRIQPDLSPSTAVKIRYFLITKSSKNSIYRTCIKKTLFPPSSWRSLLSSGRSHQSP